MQNPATANTASASSATVQTAATKRWRTEDWVAVVLGFVVIAAVLLAFQWKVVDLRNVVPSFRWTTDSQIASLTPGWIGALDTISKEDEAKKQQNVVELSKSLRTALANQDRKAIEIAAGRMAALGSRTTAGALAGEIRGHAAAVASVRVFTWDNF